MNIKTSPLVQLTSEAKRPTSWWLTWIVTVVIIFGGATAGGAVGDIVLGHPKDDAALSQFVEFFVFGGNVLLLFLWVRFKEGRRFSSLGFRGSGAVRKIVVGWVIGALAMGIGVVVPWLMGEYAPGQSEHGRVGVSALVLLVPLLFVFLWQGSAEEAVTRGFLLQNSARQLPAIVAIVGSSFFFAVVHLEFSPVPLANITLYAVLASLVALEQGNLWAICGIHAGWNFAQGNLFGLPVSGGAEPTTLWAFGPTADSHTLLSGGDFGVEASLVGTVILAVGVVIAWVRYQRADARRATTVAEPEAAS
jgi:uncharacterized protein